MANEATVGISLVFDDGTSYVQFGKSGLTIDVSGAEYLKSRQLVSDSEEVLALGDVAKGGLAAFYNSHATAVIKIRPGTGVADLVRLEPGDVALLRIDDDSTPYVISSVAGAALEYLLIDP